MGERAFERIASAHPVRDGREQPVTGPGVADVRRRVLERYELRRAVGPPRGLDPLQRTVWRVVGADRQAALQRIERCHACTHQLGVTAFMSRNRAKARPRRDRFGHLAERARARQLLALAVSNAGEEGAVVRDCHSVEDRNAKRVERVNRKLGARGTRRDNCAVRVSRIGKHAVDARADRQNDVIF